jgi:hypothetical protein
VKKRFATKNLTKPNKQQKRNNWDFISEKIFRRCEFGAIVGKIAL